MSLIRDAARAIDTRRFAEHSAVRPDSLYYTIIELDITLNPAIYEEFGLNFTNYPGGLEYIYEKYPKFASRFATSVDPEVLVGNIDIAAKIIFDYDTSCINGFLASTDIILGVLHKCFEKDNYGVALHFINKLLCFGFYSYMFPDHRHFPRSRSRKFFSYYKQLLVEILHRIKLENFVYAKNLRQMAILVSNEIFRVYESVREEIRLTLEYLESVNFRARAVEYRRTMPRGTILRLRDIHYVPGETMEVYMMLGHKKKLYVYKEKLFGQKYRVAFIRDVLG